MTKSQLVKQTRESVAIVNKSIVDERGLDMKPGKHERSKQRCQDLCWKIQDRPQSFILRSCIEYESRNQHGLQNSQNKM